MTAIKDLATELRLHRVSIAEYCRNHGIETFRRLPAGASGGQMAAHVGDDDADRIRAHYAARLAGLNG